MKILRLFKKFQLIMQSQSTAPMMPFIRFFTIDLLWLFSLSEFGLHYVCVLFSQH